LRYRAEFAPKSTIQKVLNHRVAVATYYEMSEQEYFELAKAKPIKNYRDIPILIKQDKENDEVTVAYLGVSNPTYQEMPTEEYLETVNKIMESKTYQSFRDTPIFIKKDRETNRVTVAYLGAGAILRDNYVLTVNHLFDKEDYYNFMHIWVFKENIDYPIQATMVARTRCELITRYVHFYDYAIIHLEEDLELPGLKIAKPGTLKMGDKVIFTGSTGGLAWFTRFGYITKLQKYFQKDYEGKLKLSSFEKFPFWTVYPGGPGDSGGFVTNVKGEIVTVMYCGVTVYSEEYIFGNPTRIVWDFLKEFKLEHLAR